MLTAERLPTLRDSIRRATFKKDLQHSESAAVSPKKECRASESHVEISITASTFAMAYNSLWNSAVSIFLSA